jgi:hypothetical protein
MNNTLSTQIQNLVNKLPVTLFFEELKDRQQALKYVQWLYDNVPESKTITPQDKLFREVISKELRLVSMKTIEIEILLMVGLESITLNDFSIDSKTLVNRLISENHDNYDLDIMYRIVAQIMTKLPKDLKERVTGKQKLQLFQKISQYINIDSKLLEQFASVDPSLSLNTPVSMELDEGDYNTLNKKYLFELKQYEEAKGYVSAESMEYANFAEKHITSSPNANPNTNNLKAQYIDNSPDFMLGQNDNTLYYFDSSSGALTEMPLNSKQKQVSLKDLKTVLTSGKVKQDDIQGLINDLQTPTSTAPTPSILSSDPSMPIQPKTFFDTIGSFFTSGSRFQATGTSTPIEAPIVHTDSSTDLVLPIPPQYILDRVNYNRGGVGSMGSSGTIIVQMPDQDNQSVSNYTTSRKSNGPVKIVSRDITTYRNDYTKINDDTKRIIERQLNRNNNNDNNDSNNDIDYQRDTPYKYKYSQTNNLEKRFKSRADTYEPIFTQHSSSKKKSFMNRTDANDIFPNKPRPEKFTNMNEESFLTKIKNDNKQIENVALSFVTIIILVFLLVIFNTIRNNK